MFNFILEKIADRKMNKLQKQYDDKLQSLINAKIEEICKTIIDDKKSYYEGTRDKIGKIYWQKVLYREDVGDVLIKLSAFGQWILRPFWTIHDNQYLTICYWNLREKYIRGQKGFTKEIWDKIDERYKSIIGGLKW